MAITAETAKRIEQIIQRVNGDRPAPKEARPKIKRAAMTQEQRRQRDREYYAANREKIKQKACAWRKRNPPTPEQRKADSEKAMAWQKANPGRAKRSMRLYALRNRDRINARRMTESPEKKQLRNQRTYAFHAARPWYRPWQSAKQRCNNPKTTGYEFYGGRGITCHLIEADVKFLWFRDRAWEQKKPSLDRINSELGYTLENCRFVELSFNTRKAKYDTIERRRHAYVRARAATGQTSANVSEEATTAGNKAPTADNAAESEKPFVS